MNLRGAIDRFHVTVTFRFHLSDPMNDHEHVKNTTQHPVSCRTFIHTFTFRAEDETNTRTGSTEPTAV